MDGATESKSDFGPRNDPIARNETLLISKLRAAPVHIGDLCAAAINDFEREPGCDRPQHPNI